MWFKRISVCVTESSDNFACIDVDINNYKDLVAAIQTIMNELGIEKLIEKVKLWRVKANEYVWYTPSQVENYLGKTKKNELKVQITLKMPVKDKIKRKQEPVIENEPFVLHGKKTIRFKVRFDAERLPQSGMGEVTFYGHKLGVRVGRDKRCKAPRIEFFHVGGKSDFFFHASVFVLDSVLSEWKELISTCHVYLRKDSRVVRMISMDDEELLAFESNGFVTLRFVLKLH
jgi:hypothetical protein